MKIATIQVSKWRLAKDRGFRLMDTTVKSGYSIFSPTWDLVLGHKQATLSDDEYSQQYRDLLIHSWRTQRQKWLDFLNDNDEYYALACYCRYRNEDGTVKFCHRHLLVKFLEKLCSQMNLPFEYYGELTDEIPKEDGRGH